MEALESSSLLSTLVPTGCFDLARMVVSKCWQRRYDWQHFCSILKYHGSSCLAQKSIFKSRGHDRLRRVVVYFKSLILQFIQTRHSYLSSFSISAMSLLPWMLAAKIHLLAFLQFCLCKWTKWKLHICWKTEMNGCTVISCFDFDINQHPR